VSFFKGLVTRNVISSSFSSFVTYSLYAKQNAQADECENSSHNYVGRKTISFVDNGFLNCLKQSGQPESFHPNK
jgi:hypothetical protein